MAVSTACPVLTRREANVTWVSENDVQARAATEPEGWLAVQRNRSC